MRKRGTQRESLPQNRRIVQGETRLPPRVKLWRTMESLLTEVRVTVDSAQHDAVRELDAIRESGCNATPDDRFSRTC